MGKKRRKRVSCPNCRSQLRDDMNFCFNCGQENHIKRVSIKMLATDFTSTYFSVDSKFFTSLKYLLTKPSFLSLEYLSGKIEAYLRPIRMYVFISFAFFLLNSITSPSNISSGLKFSKEGEQVTIEEVQKDLIASENKTTADEDDFFSSMDEIFDGKFKKIISDKRELNSFVTFLRSKLPILFFFLIPVLALLLHMFFYKKDYYYVDHLVFALHLQSYLFVLLIVATIIEWIFKVDLTSIAVLVMLAYGFIAARKFYKRGKLATFIRLSFIGVFHSILSTLLLLLFVYLVVKNYNI